MRRLASILLLAPALLGCPGGGSLEAGVGGSNEGCGLEGTHSVLLGMHSCACEPGYAWCSDALEDFACCPSEAPETTDSGGSPPDEACGEDELEELRCVADPEDPTPGGGVVWACNGEHWVEVPGYADFACAAEGLPFAYGCVPGPQFLCGFGAGTTCEVGVFGGICVDEDIIDTCLWGKRTRDRCSRLCTELEAYGPGYASGVCVPSNIKSEPATCVCGA